MPPEMITPSGSAPRVSSQRRIRWAAGTILLGSLGSYLVVLPVFRGTLQEYYGVETEGFGLLLSIGMIPGALAALAAGAMIQRRGARSVLRVSLLGLGGGMLLAAVAARWTVMLVAVAAMACFAGPLHIAVQSYLANLFPRRRRRVLSMHLVAASAVGALYPLWAEWLLSLQASHPSIRFAHVLHVPFAALAVVSVLGGLLYVRRKSLARPPPAAAPASRWHWARLSRAGAGLVVLMVLHGTCDTAIYFWMPKVLDGESFSRHLLRPGVVVACYLLAYALSRALLAMLPERTGRRAMLVVPGLLGGGLFLAGILSRTQALTGIAWVLGAFVWSVEYPAMMAWLAEKEGRRFGAGMAMCSVGAGVATFAMMNVMGWMGGAIGEERLWTILLIPAAGYPLVGIGGAIWVWRFGRDGG